MKALENVQEEGGNEKLIGYSNDDKSLMQCAIAHVLVPQVLGDLFSDVRPYEMLATETYQLVTFCLICLQSSC